MRIFQQYVQLGKTYWGRHLGARGYSISTVGLAETQIRLYVQWQEKREKQVENQQRRLFD